MTPPGRRRPGLPLAPAAVELLRDLADPDVGLLDAGGIAVVCAHPDDETVGIGAQLPRLTGIRIVHVTDGAPADMRDAREHGFGTREAYAAARRDELETAMARAGIPPVRITGLGVADQEAAQVLPGLSRRMADLFEAMEIGLVVTHAYEGGHPDHDATCFTVQAGATLLARRGRPAPSLLEMTGYHAGPDGNLETGVFLPRRDCPETLLPLDEDAADMKRRLLACHRTQAATLSQFRLEVERLRPAPAYDFLAPPHPGRPWYENFAWGMDLDRWLDLAAAATADLGLEAPPWR